MDKEGLHTHTIRSVFTQKGNTLGTTASIECLEVSLDSQAGDESPFFTIKTDDGWSFDSIDDFIKVLKSVERAWEAMGAARGVAEGI